MSDLSYEDLLDETAVVDDTPISSGALNYEDLYDEEDEEAPISSPAVTEPLPIIKDESLKVDDIVNTTKYVDKIRDYMVDRKGKQFLSMDKEELVDKFVTHMRYFNTNEAFTLDEARYVSLADADGKARAGEAYKVYDMLGNVFVNDGLGGAVGGVADYLGAIATSPSTYFGFGVGKGLALAGGKMAASAVKEAAKGAVKKTLKDAAGKGIGKEARKKLARDASDDVIKNAVKKRAKYNVGITGTADAGTAYYQDSTLQSDILMETGAQLEYDPFQTGLSVFGSGFATGLSIWALPKMTGASERDLSSNVANKIRKANQVKQKEITDKEALDKLQKKYLKNLRAKAEGMKKVPLRRLVRPYDYKGFPELVQGEIADPKLAVTDDLPADVLEFIFGKAGDSPTDNIVRLVESQGAVFRRNMNPAQKYARAFKYLNKETLEEMSQLTKEKFGVYLGEVLDEVAFAEDLGKKVAASVSEGAKKLRAVQLDHLSTDQALAQATMDVLEGTSKLSDQIGDFNEFSLRTKIAGTPKSRLNKFAGYSQNVWKRTLVSAPQTTAANVFGFGQYYIANTAAELLQATMYGITGDTAKFKALMGLQYKKLKNLLDPYSTLDNYEELLKTDDRLGKLLKETIAGGIERTAQRFDFNKESKLLRTVEGAVNTAQTISAVTLQDTLTKSQMFMGSLDKQLRLLKNKSFDDVLKEGSLIDIDDSVMERAMSETLKSVFAEDYTRKGGLISGLAKQVESASNTPGIGFILPFGRFMNNVVATGYRYSPLVAIEGASAIMKGNKIDGIEALSRAMVGTTALGYAISFQDAQEKKGYHWYELNTGSGETQNMTNVFPLSLLMITGRVVNKRLKGEFVDRDLATEFGKQIAIGQAATDLQFGNDITRLIQLTLNADGEFKGPIPQAMEGLGHITGNVLSGYTRPLDVANKLTAYAMQEWTPYDITPNIDRRQAKGFTEKLSLNATKYVDNMIEGVMSVVNGETTLLGDELRVANREGNVFDPSPYRTLTGQKVQQPRTSANIVFGMVNKPEWKTGMYTGVPEYDRFANEVLAPSIEREATILLQDESFLKADADTKKVKVEKMLNSVKKDLRDYLAEIPLDEKGILYRKTKLENVPKITMRRAQKIAGIQDVSLRDMTPDEVTRLESAVDYIKTGVLD